MLPLRKITLKLIAPFPASISRNISCKVNLLLFPLLLIYFTHLVFLISVFVRHFTLDNFGQN